MLIEIQRDIFNDIEDQEKLRKLILDLGYKHRYDYYIDIPVVEHSELFRNLYESNKEVIGEYFIRQTTENNKINYSVSNTNQSNTTFSLDESIIFFNQPFQIILENSSNDCYFLNAMINNFKKVAKKIRIFKREHWLRYEMGGGADNIINFIEAEKNNHGGQTKFLKCYVLIDSDLEYPLTPNPKRKKLEEYLEKNKVRYHILEKREMENYLPDQIVEKVSGDEFIKTYLGLSQPQKDYIDLENGFQYNRMSLEKRKPEIFKYYQSLSDVEIEKLRHGLKHLFKNFKVEFPKLFEEATQEGLLQITKNQNDPEELQNILKDINSLL